MRYNHENDLLRFDIGVGGVSCTFKSGANLEAFRAAEREFSRFLPQGYELELTCGSALGVDLGFLGKIFEGATLEDKRLSFIDLVNKQAALLDGDGFVKPHSEVVKGSLRDYVDNLGIKYDVIVCVDNNQKKRVKQMFNGSTGGVWSGLEFTLPVIADSDDDDETEENIAGEEIKEELLKVFTAWAAAEWVVLNIDAIQEKQEFAQPSGSEILTQASMDEVVRIINDLRNHPLGAMKEDEREKIFWGGGKAPATKKARESFVRKTFPLANERLPASEFVAIVMRNAETEWGLREKAPEMGDFDPKMLAVGQIIRAQGQVVFTEGGRFIEYVPQPMEWKDSQKRAFRENA